MSFNACTIVVILTALAAFTVNARGEERYAGGGAAPGTRDEFFSSEVWPKVGAKSCLECHKAGGDAEDSDFVLVDPDVLSGPAQDQAIRENRKQFAEMGRMKSGDESRLLLKAAGRLNHRGKAVLKPDSTGYHVLADFVTRLYAPPRAAVATGPAAAPFFDGVVMLEDRRLLRRVTLSLTGRLPTDAEMAAVQSEGLKAIPGIMDALMKEDAFYTRLREGFNDIFLTTGYDDVAQGALDYAHFEKTRFWTQNYDVGKFTDPHEAERARWKLDATYAKAFQGEPMKLVEYIVRNDHPFTEIVTADYIMVTPYTARGYGIYDEVKARFKNPDDPFEYIPVRLKALIGRNQPDEDEDSASGYYAHAGLLSTFQYIKRYPTTETNRNRARARVFYQQFLGVDVLELAVRVSDAAAVTAKFKVPTMQAAECVVCHKTVDPVAGLFQDYWNFDGGYARRKGGWFTDMFSPGYEGEGLPADQRWRALQWLGERTAKDPRFATAMVEHGWYILTGRKALRAPKDIDDPMFSARLRAYQEQRKQIESIAERFSHTGFNFKQVLKDWVVTDFYRADALASGELDARRRAELDDIGLVRMLAPEQLERKVAAVFGRHWGKLDEKDDNQLAMLYGGIDSKEVTERAADPSGAMGAIQRIMANEVACRETALDFSRPAEKRRLFPEVEPDVLPGASPEADAKIRRTIARLHELVLGRDDAPDSAEVDRTYQLFAGIVADAAGRKDIDTEENWSCRQNLEQPVHDPKYTVRAWRAVLTYLLRRPEFLYE